MNSQKKQSSRAGIKTDKYGVPLNYGNYKNGRLVAKKGGGGRGCGRGGGRGGRSGRGGRGINGKATNGKLTNNSKRNDSGDVSKGGRGAPSLSTKSKAKKGQQKQTLQSNLREQPSHLKPASVGLTGEAHNVIKEALLSSSNSNTNLQQLLNDNATSSSTNPQQVNALFRSSGNGNTNANNSFT